MSELDRVAAARWLTELGDLVDALNDAARASAVPQGAIDSATSAVVRHLAAASQFRRVLNTVTSGIDLGSIDVYDLEEMRDELQSMMDSINEMEGMSPYADMSGTMEIRYGRFRGTVEISV